MKTFQNKQDGFKAIQIKVLKITLPIAAMAMLIGLTPGLTNPETHQVRIFPVVVMILLALAGYGIVKGLNRQRAIFQSYRLTIDRDSIQREALNTPTVKIAKSDITEIIQGNNGNMLIRSQRRTDFIAVSALINNLDDVRMELNQIKEIKTLPAASVTRRFSYLMVVGVLAVMAIVYLSTSQLLVVGSVSVLTLFLTWSFYEVQTSKNVDLKTRRGSWWTLLVILSVIAITYWKLKK